MATIVELGGVRPTIGEGVWLAPTAALIGDVHVGDRANVWFGAVLRGDASRITVTARTSCRRRSARTSWSATARCSRAA
jgi:carbonic anhydrase/acetyltransferase-like protein (isoleucine patch superfamily)